MTTRPVGQARRRARRSLRREPVEAPGVASWAGDGDEVGDTDAVDDADVSVVPAASREPGARARRPPLPRPSPLASG